MTSPQQFALGDRVRILDHHHWARGALGTITSPPREVAMLAGPGVFYWVSFDVEQMDVEGDGPYVSGEIIGTALEVA